MRIIGAIGKNGSGKDEVLKYLRDCYGVPFVSTGDLVRSLAAEEGLEPTRENLGAVSARWFAKHGPGCFVRLAAEKIAANGWPVAGISGIRSVDDVRLLKAAYGESFLLVHVLVSDDFVRLDRMTKRAEARDPADLPHFRELDRQEEELFRVSEAIAFADHTIANDGTLADLHAVIDRLVNGANLLAPGSARSAQPSKTDHERLR